MPLQSEIKTNKTMTYYKVKSQYDQKRVKGGYFLIDGELYTECETKKYGIRPEWVDKVEIKKTLVGFIFGARMTLAK